MAGERNQEGGANTEATAIVFIIVVAIALLALWYFARPAILYPLFTLDFISIKIIETVKGLGAGGQTAKAYVSSIFDGRRNPYDGVAFSDFYAVRDIVGQQTRWVISGIILICAAVVMKKMKGQGYRRVFSLGGGKDKPIGLNHYQSGHWKVAATSAYFEPDGLHKEILPARTPLEWMRDNKIEYENSFLDRDATEEAFIKQIGQPWNGVKKASLIYQTIALLCGLHMTFHKDRLKERESLSIAWAGSSDGTKAMEEFVARHINNKELTDVIDAVCKKHAWSNPALFALLSKARERAGVFPSSDFLWLRFADRNLHYALNNCGRRRFHTEGAGAVSHYNAEIAIRSPLHEPHVVQAIDGIEDYLAEQGIMSLTEFFEKAEGDEFA